MSILIGSKQVGITLVTSIGLLMTLTVKVSTEVVLGISTHFNLYGAFVGMGNGD